MTTIRRIVTSQVDGNDANTNNSNEIRPFGETAFYLEQNGPVDKMVLSIHDGVRTHLRSKVLGPGVLYGSNADAGDGSNADTIKLIPDALLYDQGSNQYIVVDPTGGEPGHIHLRAGGTQDASSADLYLGGELTCVRVSDTSGIVTVRTTNVGDPNITLDWSFQQDGNLYFPGIGNTRIGESEPGLVVSSDASVVLQSNNNGESKELIFGTDGSITLPGGMTVETKYGGSPRLVIDGKGNYVDIRDSGVILVGYNSTGNVQIGNPEGGTTTEIISEKLRFFLQAVPTHSTGAPGDMPGFVAFDNDYMYYCTGLYGQTGHQIVVAADYLGRTSLNTNSFQLTKTADTLQITAGDIISDSNGGATSTVESVTSDENYVYVSTGSFAYDAIFPLTFTSTDYIPGANIWKRVAWSADTW